MIHIVFCSERKGFLSDIKKTIINSCSGVECTYLSFEYPMDILDYLMSARPDKCVVYYLPDVREKGLEIATKVTEINPTYRFHLICEEFEDTEALFLSGVSCYIKFPVKEDILIKSAELIKRFYNEQMQKVLLLKNKYGTDAVPFAEIDYVMSDKRKVVVHRGEHESEYYYKLDEIEEKLGIGFLRCHQSFIVNMRKIKVFVTGGVMLYDDTFIPVSRNKYYAAKREYLSYITGNRLI